ncbi:hypothetical protein ASF71_21615 [Deinococcus sp. Leaf326]|nr:hypothetical protein ASF71_21615 [Deinococcus sp. Leaf326]
MDAGKTCISTFFRRTLGVLFELDAANVCRNIHALLPRLEQAVPAPLRAWTLDSGKIIPF